VAGALAFAGIAKAIRPDDFGLLRLFGDTTRDPFWFSHIVAGMEIDEKGIVTTSPEYVSLPEMGMTTPTAFVGTIQRACFAAG